MTLQDLIFLWVKKAYPKYPWVSEANVIEMRYNIVDERNWCMFILEDKTVLVRSQPQWVWGKFSSADPELFTKIKSTLNGWKEYW